MKEFTFIASINALEERVAILEEKMAALVEPQATNYDQEEEEVEEE